MILHAALLLVRGGRDVEHVFDPVGAVGDLNLPPVVVGVLEAAVPVHTEAEEIPIEAILGSAVLDDEAGVKHARADLFGGGREKHAGGQPGAGGGITFAGVGSATRRATDISGEPGTRATVG